MWSFNNLHEFETCAVTNIKSCCVSSYDANIAKIGSFVEKAISFAAMAVLHFLKHQTNLTQPNPVQNFNKCSPSDFKQTNLTQPNPVQNISFALRLFTRQTNLTQPNPVQNRSWRRH